MRTEDGYLIQQCLDGDHAAYGLLVDKYKRGIYALAFSRVRNFHDAQDITQEAFVKAYQNLHTLRRWDNFIGWLYRITSNLCRDWVRSASKHPDREFVEDQDPDTIDNVSMDSYIKDSAYESIKESLELLPEIYREVLTLRYFGGMSVREMSRFLGASPRTIDRRLSEAMSRLKEETLAMMTTTKERHELPGSFTFRIVEIVKHIRVSPLSPMKALPWGLSLATGIIITIMSFGLHPSWLNTTGFIASSHSLGESKVLNVGEYHVDVMKVSDISVMTNQQLNGNGLGSIVPNLQNALFMAPQVGDTWTKKADMPTARWDLSTCTVNGKVYAIGGYMKVAPGYSSTVEEYDPVVDKWIRKADMPTDRNLLSTCAVNGKIYAIGGFNGLDPLSIVEEYDPEIDTWTKKADMPTARLYFTTSAVNGKIYAIGGSKTLLAENLCGLSVVEEYDPMLDKWTKKTDMPTPRQRLGSASVNGKIYAVGGENPGDPKGIFSTVEEYDPATDTWTRKADMLTRRSAEPSEFIISANGRIYAIGGHNLQQDPLSTVEEYDVSKNTWTMKASMPRERVQFATSEVNGKIYVIGGCLIEGGHAASVSLVEEYDPGATGESINFKGKLPTTWGEVRTVLNR